MLLTILICFSWLRHVNQSPESPLNIGIIAGGCTFIEGNVNQVEILQHLYQGAIGHKPSYDSLPLCTVPLSQLWHHFTTKCPSFALLSNRTWIAIDPDFMVQPADDSLVWDTDKSTIDYMLCVGARIGFDAAIPMDTNQL